MYNFDELIDRRNSSSYKWDKKSNVLPMWVADMDFACAPCIMEAIKKRLECPVFGYTLTPDGYFDSYISWWERRHNIKYNKDWLLFSTGVVPSISSIVRRLTNPAEKVIIQSPVYNIFYNSIYNNGRYIYSSDLVYENGKYHIDFNDLEKKMSDPQATLMILCNPHNPIGKIWSFDELDRISKLAYKYNVIVVSDEIHCDITEPGSTYVPYISVSKEAKMNSVTCISATKCFGIPGLQSSALVIPNEALRNRVNRGLNNDEVAEGNFLAYLPIMAAFNDGEEWVNEMNKYVSENKKVFKEILNDTDLYIVDSDATYLLWCDVSKYTRDSKLLVDYLLNEYKLFITEGSEYGINGKQFVRINLATQRVRVIEGANILKEALNKYKE